MTIVIRIDRRAGSVSVAVPRGAKLTDAHLNQIARNILALRSGG